MRRCDMQFANEHMTPDEQVAFAWRHREHFAAVAVHNLDVICRRRAGGDWTASENQYRNAWAEIPRVPPCPVPLP